MNQICCGICEVGVGNALLGRAFELHALLGGGQAGQEHPLVLQVQRQGVYCLQLQDKILTCCL